METSKFDIADYLDSNEIIAEYLKAVLEEGDDTEIITAIGHIAKAIGITHTLQFLQSRLQIAGFATEKTV